MSDVVPEPLPESDSASVRAHAAKGGLERALPATAAALGAHPHHCDEGALLLPEPSSRRLLELLPPRHALPRPSLVCFHRQHQRSNEDLHHALSVEEGSPRLCYDRPGSEHPAKTKSDQHDAIEPVVSFPSTAGYTEIPLRATTPATRAGTPPPNPNPISHGLGGVGIQGGVDMQVIKRGNGPRALRETGVVLGAALEASRPLDSVPG